MNRDTSVDVDRACRDAYWHECAGNLAADRFPALSPPQPAPITRQQIPHRAVEDGGARDPRHHVTSPDSGDGADTSASFRSVFHQSKAVATTYTAIITGSSGSNATAPGTSETAWNGNAIM
jgi:hypothetical protein